MYEVGDTGVDFTIQSVSKPFIYGLALQERGLDEVLSRVGVEPSGNTFNAIVVDGSNRPFNPMVNAGAIVSTAMSRSEDQVLGLLGRFAGRDLSIDEAVYQSERITGDRNRAIGYLMSSFELMGDDATAAIDRYFRQCSVSVTCRDLAIMAGTLANRGSNPVTAVRALGEAEVESVISVMSSCGMYDASGEWMLRVGMPAKSGVSGAVIAVMPGQFGIAVFSPLLDHHFNSVRGLQVCERMSAEFTLHPMRFQADVGGVIRRIYTCTAARSSRLRPVEESAVLDDHGYLAAIVELQGELFVAAAERVLRAVTEQLETSDIIVLDFSRVTVADPAATALLERLAAELEPTDATIVFASRPDAPALEAAIEWCEDRILHQHRPDALGAADPPQTGAVPQLIAAAGHATVRCWGDKIERRCVRSPSGGVIAGTTNAAEVAGGRHAHERQGPRCYEPTRALASAPRALRRWGDNILRQLATGRRCPLGTTPAHSDGQPRGAIGRHGRRRRGAHLRAADERVPSAVLGEATADGSSWCNGRSTLPGASSSTHRGGHWPVGSPACQRCLRLESRRLRVLTSSSAWSPSPSRPRNRPRSTRGSPSPTSARSSPGTEPRSRR